MRPSLFAGAVILGSRWSLALSGQVLVVLDCRAVSLQLLTMAENVGKKGPWYRLWSGVSTWVATSVLCLWWRTLRFRLDPSVSVMHGSSFPPSIVLLWHNRLFAAPEFYRRFFRDRRLAALVSASSDGGWLSAFLQRLGIRQVRGSSHNRGGMALRGCLDVLAAGFDVAITPDGSRGPVYAMKQGAAAVALKTGAPVYLLSLHYDGALRLGSWDRFFLPLPFSTVRACLEQVTLATPSGGQEDPLQEAQTALQSQMEAMIGDPLFQHGKWRATNERPGS